MLPLRVPLSSSSALLFSMIPALLLLASVLMFRVAPWLSGAESVRALAGWSPLMALALCGSAFFPRRWALAAGVAAVVVPHFIINSLQGYPLWDSYLPTLIVVVLAVAQIGATLGKRAPLAAFLGASVLATALFHLATNTVSFLSIPGYPASLAGWVQAQTTGLPQYSPATWVFSLRQLAGDLLFTSAFVLACRPLPSPAAAPRPALA